MKAHAIFWFAVGYALSFFLLMSLPPYLVVFMMVGVVAVGLLCGGWLLVVERYHPRLPK